MNIPEKNSPGLNQATDGMLIQAWKSGNQEAAEIFFDRYALRLAALVAKRMQRQLKSTISADDVVQSALGSFFLAAKQSRIQVSQSVSLWRLLATFAKRKLIRSIERKLAIKRGGKKQTLSLEQVAAIPTGDDHATLALQADELLEHLRVQIPDEIKNTFEHLIAGNSIQEIANVNQVSKRTVGRQISRIRDIVIHQTDLLKLELPTDQPTGSAVPDRRPRGPFDSKLVNRSEFSFHSDVLPQWRYGDFVLGKMIGAGGFGKVYRATKQNHQGFHVAVKFLRKSFWQNLNAKKMLLAEVEQASRIEHDSVVKYLGWGESPHGGPFLVMQWIEGGRPLAEQQQVLSAEQFSKYLIDVCQTMAYVHDIGIVHGDLTTNNILIGENGRHWISDFGFSCQTPQSKTNTANIDQPQSNTSEETLMLGGTMGFAAPEQVDNAWGEVGTWTDIYAMGGLAFWYLTGLAPHQSETVADTLLSTIQSADLSLPDPVSYSRPLQNIADVAHAGLKQSIAQRAHSMTELIKILRR